MLFERGCVQNPSTCEQIPTHLQSQKIYHMGNFKLSSPHGLSDSFLTLTLDYHGVKHSVFTCSDITFARPAVDISDTNNIDFSSISLHRTGFIHRQRVHKVNQMTRKSWLYVSERENEIKCYPDILS
jgi:hypothetical protein